MFNQYLETYASVRNSLCVSKRAIQCLHHEHGATIPWRFTCALIVSRCSFLGNWILGKKLRGSYHIAVMTCQYLRFYLYFWCKVVYPHMLAKVWFLVTYAIVMTHTYSHSWIQWIAIQPSIIILCDEDTEWILLLRLWMTRKDSLKDRSIIHVKL